MSGCFRDRRLQQLIEKYTSAENSAIYLDVLKDLCSDTVTTERKQDLLLLLEEQASTWLTTAENIEQVVGSLQSLYKQLCKSKQYLLSRQILITSTVILITSSNPDTDPQLCDLLYKHIDYLVQIASSLRKHHPLIKLAACQCLQEVEEVFPGILATESYLDSLWPACTKESSVVFQSYASLLSLVLLNSSTKRETNSNKLSPPGSPLYSFSLDPLSMYLVDLFPLLSPATLHFVMSCLIQNADAQVSIYADFKTWIPIFFQSSYLPLNHFAIYYSDKVSPDNANALQHLMSTANHPLTPISQRLVILQWIEAALKKKYDCVNVIPKGLPWAPNTYDGADSQERKLRLLGHLLLNRDDLHSGDSSNMLQLILLHFLDSLTESGVRTVAVLYRVLLHFYMQPNNLELENHICRVAVSFLQVSFNTIHYLLDFVASLQKSNRCSHSTEMILDYITNWMTDSSKMEALHNQDTYLYALHKIVIAPESAPAKVRCQLQFLQSLLTTSEAYHDWQRGHKIITAATALLNRNDVMLLYSDLSELLFRFLNSETSDVDVRNRGKILYSVISQNHGHLLLNYNSKGSLAIPHLLSEQNVSTFPAAYQIHTLPADVVSLKIYSRKEMAADKFDVISIRNKTGTDIDINQYFSKLQSILIPLCLELKLHTDNDSGIKALYSLELVIKSEESDITDSQSVHIPVLSDDETNGSHVFTFRIKPFQVQPPLLNFKLTFTTVDCHSYAGHLESQQLSLHELFLPLPVQNAEKSALFQALLTEHVNKLQPDKEYACAINISIADLREKWREFFVTNGENEKRVAMYLVPSTHVLIRLTSFEETGVQILFATDNVEILPVIFNYLNNIRQ